MPKKKQSSDKNLDMTYDLTSNDAIKTAKKKNKNDLKGKEVEEEEEYYVGQEYDEEQDYDSEQYDDEIEEEEEEHYTNINHEVDTEEERKENAGNQKEKKNENLGKEVKKVSKMPKMSAQNQPMLELILTALMKMDHRNGVSFVALKKYILDEDQYEGKSWNKLKIQLKFALEKGLENNLIIRPRKSENINGMAGSFKINKKALKEIKKRKEATSKKETNRVKSGEASHDQKSIRSIPVASNSHQNTKTSRTKKTKLTEEGNENTNKKLKTTKAETKPSSKSSENKKLQDGDNKTKSLKNNTVKRKQNNTSNIKKNKNKVLNYEKKERSNKEEKNSSSKKGTKSYVEENLKTENPKVKKTLSESQLEVKKYRGTKRLGKINSTDLLLPPKEVKNSK